LERLTFYRATTVQNSPLTLLESLKIYGMNVKLSMESLGTHPQSQGSVERANADVKDMNITWMRENHTNDWPGINWKPYKAMFGVDAKVGLVSSSLPDELISKVDTEEHLFDLATMEVNTNTDIDSAHSTDDEAMDTSEVQPSVGTSNVCVVCQDIVFGEFKCLSCNKNVLYVKCGKTRRIRIKSGI
jgi:hypothetical protein